MTTWLKITLIQRYLFIPVLTLFVVSASNDLVLNSFLVVGIAHFFMSHIDQYRRGHYDKSPILYSVPFLVAFLMISMSNEHFKLLVGTFFIVHSFFDDLHLMDLRVNRKIVLVSLPYLSFSIASVLSVWAAWQAILPSMVGYFCVLAYSFFTGLWRNHYIFYVLCITPIIFFIYFNAPLDISYKALGFIVLMHVFNWYTYLYQKFKYVSSERFTSYILEAFCINLFLFFTIQCSSLVYDGHLFNWNLSLDSWRHTKETLYNNYPLTMIVLDPRAFRFLALTHMIVTIRKGDYSKLNPFSRKTMPYT